MAVRPLRGAGPGRAAAGRARALAGTTAGRAVGLVGLYAAAAVVATAPAVGHFRSAFIASGAPGFGEAAAGDHLQSVYRFWLLGHQLEHGAAPWRDPLQFQPLAEPQLVLASWPFGIPFWPLDALFGPVVAWNALLLAGIVLAGVATYAWLRAVEISPIAAAIGGLLFAVAPYRIIQSGGHLLGWIAIFMPVALWAYERSRSATSRRAEHGFGALAAAALVTIPLSGQVHLALGALPLAVLYAAVRFRRAPFLWVLGAAIVGAAVAVAIQQTVIDGSVLAGGGRSLDQIELFQADWSGFVDRFGLEAREQDTYIGWLTPLVALAGLAVLARRSWKMAVLAALALLVPLLLAVGTNLPTYEPLFHHFPPMRFPRVPERLLPIADLVLAALVAVALGWALTRIAAGRRALVGGIAALVLAADLLVLPLAATAADPGNGAYRALASKPPGRTLELPIFEPGIHFGSIYDYYALQAPRQRPSGYSTLAPGAPYDFFWRYDRLNCGIWLPGDDRDLEALGIRFLLFHLGAYEQSLRPNAWFAWRALQQRGYRARDHGGTVWLFPFTSVPGAPFQAPPVAEPPRGQPVLCESWKRGRMKQREAGLWIFGDGQLELTLGAPGLSSALLQVDNGQPRHFFVDGKTTISAPLEGNRWHRIVIRVPQLFGTKPPRGLELEQINLS
jgi:hypothetical protein